MPATSSLPPIYICKDALSPQLSSEELLLCLEEGLHFYVLSFKTQHANKTFFKNYLPRNDNAMFPKAQHVMYKNNSEKHD